MNIVVNSCRGRSFNKNNSFRTSQQKLIKRNCRQTKMAPYYLLLSHTHALTKQAKQHVLN